MYQQRSIPIRLMVIMVLTFKCFEQTVSTFLRRVTIWLFGPHMEGYLSGVIEVFFFKLAETF